MKTSLCLTSLFLGMLSPIMADYTGTVFLDKNNNGIKDKGERGMPGIPVSNGSDVVKTNDKGVFMLPEESAFRFLFVCTPSGYQTQKFYHPLNQKDRNFDFALTKSDSQPGKDGSHRFLHITDTEIFNTQNHEDWLLPLKNYAKNENASFIVHTGDICYEKGLKEHIALLNSNNAPCRVVYAIGNHDMVSGKYGEELFESLYGPVFYSFDVGNTHYIVTPMLSGDRKPGFTKKDVYRWMKNDLSLVPKDKSVIIFNHDQLTTGNDFTYGISNTEKINLNEHNLKAWLYGHWHFNYIKKQGDVLSISTGTIDKGGINHSSAAFRDISIDAKGNPTSRLRYPYVKNHVRIASLSGDNHLTLSDGSLPVSVNTYHTDAPTTKVVCSLTVDGKKTAPVTLTPRTDWNWTATIPGKSTWKDKKVTLNVTANYGKDISASTSHTFVYGNTSAAPVKTSEDWHNLLGNPQHTGITSPLLPPLSLAWVSNVGDNIMMTSPIISEGKVYIATTDENLSGKAKVCALDAQSGKMLWQYPLRNSVKNTIAIEDGLVFAQDIEGNFYALDKKKGTLAWEKQLPVKKETTLIEGIVTDKGRVYAGSGHALSAFEARTGKLIWKNNQWAQREGATTTLALGGNVLISGSQWQALFANDANTGKLLWKADHSGLRNRGASAAIHGDKLYIISEKTFFIMEAGSGKVLTKKELPFSVDATSTPLVTESEIIFGTSKDGLIALHKDTLEEKWRYITDDALIHTSPYVRSPAATIETSPVQSGDLIYIGASDGSFSALDRKTGKLLWKHNTGAPVLGSVALSGNSLFGVDFSGNIYAFTSKNN